MNSVQRFGAIVLLKNGITIKLTLIPDKGLQQTIYPGGISPDWTVAANQPVIHMFGQGSNSSLPVTNLSEDTWIFDGTVLAFDASGNCTTAGFTNLFKRVTYSIGGTSVPALRPIGNVMAGYSSNKTLVAGCKGTVDGNSDFIYDSIDFTRMESPGEAYIGSVEFTNGACLTPTNTTTVLTANLLMGGKVVTAGVTYLWEKWNGTTWATTGKTSKTLTVGLTDVDGQARYRVVFKVDGTTVTHGYQLVRDLSDPLEIVINIPEMAYIGVSETITITAKVRHVGKSDDLTGYTFAYALLNSSGTEIRSGTAVNGTFSVTGQEVEENNGVLNWTITATK